MDSFLVRVWHPATEPTGDAHGLCGTVMQLPSRRTIAFQDSDSLLAILAGGTDQHVDAGTEAR